MRPGREGPSPARLYAALAGVLLFLLGIAGFFYSASLGSPGNVERGLAGLEVNGWLNLLYAALGALGLLAAGTASRGYALGVGALLTLLGIWGLTLAPGDAILGLLPAAGTNEALALTLGLLGLLASAGAQTHPDEVAERPAMRAKKQPRGDAAESEAVAEAAGEGS